MKTEYHIDNLTLKICNETDVFDVLNFYYQNREYYDRFEPDKPDNFYTKEYIIKLLKAEYNSFLSGNFVRFFLYDTNVSKDIIGTVSFSHILNGAVKSCTIGYKIDHNYWRLGYCHKMLSEAIARLCDERGIHRIEAYIHPGNVASIAVAKSLDFTDEGIAYSYIQMQGRWQDHLRYVYIAPDELNELPEL